MSNWRDAADVPLAFWTTYLSGMRSPLATIACWEAARPLSRFLLAVAVGESQAGTSFRRNRRENMNALNLRPPLRPDGTREPGDYMAFPTWEAGIRSARERITSPTYGGGVYARTRTVAEFAAVWAPAFDDNDPERFAAAIEQRLASYPRVTEEPMNITFGNVPAPFERRIIDKDAGWRWGDRTIRGVCLHSMVGYLIGTENYFMDPNSGHGWNALTDFGIGGSADGVLDGDVWMWNDPHGNRIPFANGWGNEGPGLDGDGPAFVARYGVPAVNADLISIERSDGGNLNRAVSPKQLEAICKTVAWVIDQAGIPWHVWPKNNDGVQAIYWHSEFALKACPFGPVKGRTDHIIARSKAILRQYQETVEVEPPPLPEPEPAEKHTMPKGMSVQMARRLYNPFGVTDPDTGERFDFRLDRAAPQVWLAYWKREIPADGHWTDTAWAPLVSIVRQGDGGRLYHYTSGPSYEQSPEKQAA